MILIALGANLPSSFGTPEETLKAAVDEIQARIGGVEAVSSIWKTAPVPVSDQPWYRNAVVCVQSNRPAREILDVLHAIEHDFGRIRTVKNASRLLDLDLLAYGDDVVTKDDFMIPHPRMHCRAFVLIPLQEVAPNWVHPVLKRSVADLIKDLPEGQDIKTSDEKVA